MEKNRDEINKYYTLLFSAILSLTHFLDKVTTSVDVTNKTLNLRYVSIIVSLLCLVLSLSWKLTLERILNYTKGVDGVLVSIEKNFDIRFITYMSGYLRHIHSPSGEARQQMLIPYAFIVIFVVMIVYSAIGLFNN